MDGKWTVLLTACVCDALTGLLADMIPIQIDHSLQVPYSHALHAALCEALTFPIPTRTGEELYCPVQIVRDQIILPRGTLGVLAKILKAQNQEFQVDSRVTGQAAKAQNTSLQPRDYQEEIIQRLLKKIQGWVCLPCGGGKTTTGVVASLRTGQTTLVLVHTLDLQSQWIETYQRAGVQAEAITDPGRSLAPGAVGVALIHALQTNAQPLLGSIGCLITDEAHHVPSRMMFTVVSQCAARYRWGLTATPERGDGWGFMLNLLFGECVYQLPARDLIQMGHLLKPTVIPVKTLTDTPARCFAHTASCPGCKASYRKWPDPENLDCQVCGKPVVLVRGDMNFTAAVTALSQDSARNDQIVRLARWASSKNRRTLVLVGRTETTLSLAAQLKTAGLRAEAVSGQTRNREELIQQLKTGALECLVATQLADEGLDVPALDTIISANPNKDAGRTQQRVGRACRPQGQPPILFDLVDAHPSFGRQWNHRISAYEAAYGPCVPFRAPVVLESALKLAERVKK